jgi:hypothetical protein
LVGSCDLRNLPNEDERLALARDRAVRAPAIVLPYGLTDDFRAALAQSAVPPGQRLAHKTICFIGMWSPRKGAHDWPKIIAAIRQLHPPPAFFFSDDV